MTISVVRAKLKRKARSGLNILNKSLSLRKRVNHISVLSILVQLDAIAEKLRLQKLVRACLLRAIRGYQKYLSPHKGFNCAYRVLHREQSCSNYFYSCISEQSLSMACSSFQQRLKDCQQAHAVLMASGIEQKLKNKKRRGNSTCEENNNCVNCRDIFDLEFFLDVLPPCNC